MAVKHKAQSAATLTVTDMIRHALSPRGQQELYQFRGECVYYDFQKDEFTLKPKFGRTIHFGWMPSLFGCTIHFGWMPSLDDSESFSNLVERIVENAAPKLYELQMGVPDPTEPLGFRDDNYMATLLNGSYHPEVVTYRQWKGLAFDCLIDRDTQVGVEESLGDFLPPGWDYLLTSTVPDVLAAALKNKSGAVALLDKCRLADLPTDDDDSIVSIIAIAIASKAVTVNNNALAEAMEFGRQVIDRRNLVLTNDHRLKLLQLMEEIASQNSGDVDLIEKEFLAWKVLIGAEGTTRINLCCRGSKARFRDGVTYYAELPKYRVNGEIERCLTAETYSQMLRFGPPSNRIEISASMLEMLRGSLAVYYFGSVTNKLNQDHFKVVPTQPEDPDWMARSLQVAQLDWKLKTQA